MIRRMQATKVALRGQALAESNARRAANRRVSRKFKSTTAPAQQAAVARWNAGATHAPDRMTVER